MTAREAIAAAITTAIPGVKVTAYGDQFGKIGSGYVELMRTEYPNKFGGEDYWEVLVLVPQDTAAAQKWMDEHRAAYVAAVSPAMVVTQVRPETVPQNDSQAVKVMVIAGHRESEE